MEILDGLYRLVKPRIIEEKHGGAILKNEVYWFVALYRTEGVAGLYGSSRHDHTNYISGKFDLKGKILEVDNGNIRFNIYNPVIDDTLNFEGSLEPQANLLKLRARYEKSKKAWGEDLYELVLQPGESTGKK